MPGKPFHHGGLRDELLRRARETLRAKGEAEVSLRGLARDAGVSHSAPRRHFPERQDLLDALVVQGFDELAAAVEAGGQAHRGDNVASFEATARIYIDFAITDAALMDLMFATKGEGAGPDVTAASQRFFDAVTSVLQTVVPPSPTLPDDEMQIRLLLVSTLHGIAALVASGRLGSDVLDQLVHDTARLFGVTRELVSSSVVPRK